MNDTISMLEQFIEPAPVRFSAETTGWHVLGGTILFMLLLAGLAMWHRYRKNKYRRVALGWLEREEKKYLGNREYSKLVYTANMLVKQISIHLYGNNTVAPLRGEDWLSYLSKTCPTISFSASDEKFLDMLYDPREMPDEQQTIDFTGKIKHWIKKHHINK